MKCPACNHENRDGAKFCEECAVPLKRVCASCGAELRPTAKFCDECGATTGASAAQRARPAEAAGARKVVTVVFADLVGSTALHERVDAESARRLMERYYDALRAAVEEHGGTVVKLLGDGVMAAFGVPQVAEDDALRAVRAGMAMQDAFRVLVSEQAASLGDVGLRVAVNTGEVVVSGANDDVVGDPVNVAARLQQEARDGDVVIGEATQRLVSTLVTLAPLGSFALKGRAEAVKAYRVVSLERPAGASATPFVGREEELARITRVYDAAVAAPAARLAVLLGSPGLGKSRLIDELARRQSETAIVISAHCDATGGATFAPLAQALRRAMHIDDGASVEALRAAVDADTPGSEPDRARIVDGITTLLAGSPASPEETFFVVRRLLAALAKERPVVLVIDDLHWAEPLLLDLVEHLIQWGSGVPLLVLVGARPELRDARSSLATPGGLVTDVVTLSGLDAGAAMRLAANVIGATDLPAAVAAKVLATSEGNPLFVGELIRMLVQEGAIERQGDRWTIGAGLAELEMPPTIHALLAARIERLRAEERIVLERAAVVGRHFSRSAVAELLPHDVTDLDARLESLRRSELIERDTGWFLGEPVLRFHHVLIRDAAYRRVLKGTRAELHARFADWIEARVGESVEHDEIIGWHLEQAHQHLGELGPIDAKGRALGERAARYLAAAGRRALARDDLPLAASLLGRALERLDKDDPSRADLALDWCEALLATGDVGPAAGAIDELGRFVAGSERLRAWHTCFAGQLTVLTEPQALHATTDAVAAAAEKLTSLGDAAGEAKAHFVHAQALARLGKIGACEAALDRALAAARRAGDRRRANAVLAGAPIAALWGPSPVTRASGRCLDVVRVLRITQGAPAVEAVALSCQGVLEALRGRTDAARRMIASSRKMVEELGITHRLLEADVFAGQIDLLEGDASAAERSLRSAYEGLRDLGLGIDAAQAAAFLAHALLAQGRAAEAESLSHECEALAGDDLKAAIAWRGVRAEALARRGEHTAAVELAEAAVAIASATDALLDHADARLALAAALRAAGRGSEANAEERRAMELWEAKGATLLAERARRGATHVDTPAQAREAHVEPRTLARRGVRPNDATAAATRFDAAFASRDRLALEVAYAEAVTVVDHPTESAYGREGSVDSFARMFRMEDPRVRHDAVATLGESLGLFRFRASARGTGGGRFDVGEFDRENLNVYEADEHARLRRVEVFANDHLDDAIAGLYERYAEVLPEGPVRTRAETTARAIAATMREKNGGAERWRTACTPDAQAIDHRQLGTWNARGADAIVEQMDSLREVADGVDICTLDILGLEPEALLLRRMHSGTERVGGGVYERPFLLLKAFGTDGRVARLEFFDDAAEAAALARFHELVGRTAEAEPPRPVQRRIRMNAARMMRVRTDAAFAAHDPDAFVPLVSDDYQEIDHPTGSTYGLDGALASIKRLLRSRDARLYHEPLATLGESLDLSRRCVRASGTGEGRFDVGEYESEAISLVEVDDRGVGVRQEVFAAEHLGDAIARMYARYAELLPEGPARERAAATARSLATAAKASEVDRFVALFAPTVEVVDHRNVGFGELHGAEALEQAVRALLELTDGFDRQFDDVFALSPSAILWRDKSFGTDRNSGGTFERSVCELWVFGADGLVTRWERFDMGHEAEALARFDELVGGRDAGRPAAGRPVGRRVRPNAATAVGARLEAAIHARNLGAIDALLGDHGEHVDHPTGARFGRQGALDSAARLLRVPDFDFQIEMLATLGESLCLVRRNVVSTGTSAGKFDVAEYELERIGVYALDDDGRIGRSEVFASDHLADAIVRLYELRAEELQEGSPRQRLLAISRSVAKFHHGFVDPQRLDSPFAVAVQMVDHRRVGLGTLEGAEAVLAAVRAFLELVEDVAWRVDDVLALTEDASLLRSTNTGIDRAGGGAFERTILSIVLYDAEGGVERWETFEVDDEVATLARFDELTGHAAVAETTTKPESLRFLNAATRLNEGFVRTWAVRDWDAFMALHAPTCELDDRRRLMRLEGTSSTFPTLRVLFEVPGGRWTVTPIATRGERLALSRLLFEGQFVEGGGDLAIDYLCVDEVDAEGLSAVVVLFDLDELDAAYAELDARYHAGEAKVHERTSTWLQSFRRALAGRDWQTLAALCAQNIVAEDHRLVSWGTLRGPGAWAVAIEKLLELAPDTRLRVDHVRTSPDGLLYESAWLGTREGGEFEIAQVVVVELDELGRQLRLDVYDTNHLADARARFDAIGASRTLQEQPFTNAAARISAASFECYAARDWSGLERLLATGFRYFDRRRIAQLELDRDQYIAFQHELDDLRTPRYERELLATRGELLSLQRYQFEYAGGDVGESEVEFVTVIEADERGQLVAFVRFDPDDLDAAYAELDARFVAGEATAHPRTLATMSALRRGWVERDWPSLLAACAPGFSVRDHRVLGWGTTVSDPAGWVRTQQALVELAPDTKLRVDHIRTSPFGVLHESAWLGTRDGGEFEIPQVIVVELDELGRQLRLDVYDTNDLADARARFDAIGASRALQEQPLANAAARLSETIFDAYVARDWPRFERFFPMEFRYFDRRRIVQLELDRQQYFDFARELESLDKLRCERELLATRGERLSLQRFRLAFAGGDVGASEIEYFTVIEADQNARCVAHVRFDIADLAAAYAELDARFDAGEARAHPRALAAMIAVQRAWVERDWTSSLAAFAPGFSLRDHRTLGWGTTVHDGAAWVRTQQALVDLAPDVRMQHEHVRLCERGWFRQAAAVGTRDGGAFELPFFQVTEVDERGLIRAHDLYDLEQVGQALGRFDEIAAAGAPGSRFTNAATRAVDRATAAFEARDWEGFGALFAADFRNFDHRAMFQLETDREQWLAAYRETVEMTSSRPTHQMLATRGDRLALVYVLWRGAEGDVGPSEIEWLLVIEVDERGDHKVVVAFDPAKLDAAYAELDARFAAGEATAYPRTLATMTALRRGWGERDWPSLLAACAPGFSVRDHRLLGWGTTVHDPEGWVRTQQALVELAPDVRMRTDHVRFCERGWLRQAASVGTRDGGAFELPLIMVSELDEQGLIRAHDLYDLEQVDQARARFDQLRASVAEPEPRFSNAASRALAQTVRCFNARDWDAMVATYAPEHRMDDRRKLMRIAVAGEGFFANERLLFEVPGSAWHAELFATRGERLALCRVKFTAGGEDAGPMAVDVLDLVEVDASGWRTALVVFDPDDLEAAYAELDARYEAGEAAAHPPITSTFTRSIAARDWAAIAALCAPAFVEHDHRSLAVLGTTHGAEAWARNFHTLVELAPDTVPRFAHVRHTARGFFFQLVLQGSREGGSYEIPVVGLLGLDARGKIERADIYDPEQLPQVRARFDEIAASASVELEPRFANAASRAMDEHSSRFNARDWAGIEARIDPAARMHDRRRMMHLEASAAEFLIGHRLMFDVPEARWKTLLLATRGERLSLHHVSFSGTVAAGGGPLMNEHLCLAEVGSDLRIAALVLFEVDDRDAAYAELDARYVAGEGAMHQSEPARYRKITDAVNRRDWDTFDSLYAPGFSQQDHRLLGWGTTLGDTRTWVRSQQALVELSPDVHCRIDHVRVSDRVVLAQVVQVGTRDGGAFEIPLIVVSEWGDAGRVLRNDSYDPDQYDEARARFEELRARDAMAPLARARVEIAKPNAADAAMYRWQALFEEATADGDWDSFRQICVPGFVFEDRRRLALLAGGYELMVASARERVAIGARLDRQLVGTAGDRVAISRMLWAGGPAEGRFEIEYLGMNEVDEAGQFTAIILFDCDDTRAVQREAWARWSAIDPAAAPWVNRMTEITDAWNAHDTARLRRIFADDVVVEDHRRTGLGRIEGADPYMNSITALWDLAPDQRVEFGWTWLARDPHAVLVTLRREGTLADGGAFENDYLWLGVAGHGRLTRLELFEPEDLDVALARFEELRPDPLRIPPNAATRAQSRAGAAMARSDWNTLRSLCDKSFVYEDRGKRSLVSGDFETWLASMQFMVSIPDYRNVSQPIATMGERISITREVWTGGADTAAFEIEHFRLTEVAADGKYLATILFDPEDRAAAFFEATERFLAGEAAAMSGRAGILAALDANARRDWSALRETMAPGFVYHDHRTLGMGVLDRDRWIASIRALADMSPDLAVEVTQVLAWDRHGAVAVTRTFGTVPDGGPFENVFVAVRQVAGNLMQRYEVFDLDDVDRALARFEDLRPDPLRIPPNAATRAMERNAKVIAARDWATLRGVLSEDFVFQDRCKRSLVKGGVEEFVTSITYIVSEIGAAGRYEILATAGERLALTRVSWRGVRDATQFEICRLTVNEVNEEGKICATILFDDDDRAAASDEMAERYVRSTAGLPSATLEVLRAWNDHDLERLRSVLPADYYFYDRRRTGVGRLDGADAYLASLEALFELSRDVRIETLYLAARAPHGGVNVTRWSGTNVEGGEFEAIYVYVGLQRGARIVGSEIFEIEDLDAALAHFEELRPDPLRIPPNAPTRVFMRARDAMLRGDWDAVRALCNESFVYEDRGKRSLVRGDFETWLASTQFMVGIRDYRNESQLIATMGERISIAYEVWTGGADTAAFEIARVRVSEVAADGRYLATILFDPDDRAAAFLEAAKRFAMGEAATMGAEAVALAGYQFSSAHVRRDWGALRETLAPDFVYHDHRALGVLGVLDGDQWVASIRAQVDISSDSALETQRLLAWNRHGVVGIYRTFGTVPGGGPFESVFVGVVHAVSGRFERFEAFDLADAERALARFEELCTAQGERAA